MKPATMIATLTAALLAAVTAQAAPAVASPPSPLLGLPAGVHFGASLAETQAAVAPVCPKLNVRRIDPPFLDVIKDRQMQIDCDGFLFQGKPRHVEFVIGDDRLGMIWLMVQPGEEAAVVGALAKAYGPPDRPNAKYWTFPGHEVAFRRDKAEILYYGAERAGDVAPDFKPPKSPSPTIAQWRTDIDSIVAHVRLTHPDPFTKTGSTTFLRAAETLKADLPALSEEQRVVRAMRLIASIGDGHTQLEPDRADFALWYPLRIVEFADGYFVTTTGNAIDDLAGAQVLEVAGHPVAEAAADARALRGSDNAMAVRENIYALMNAAMMKGLGYADASGALKLKLKLAGGKIVERTLTPRPGNDGDSTFEWYGSSEVYGPFIGRRDDWTAAYGRLPPPAFRTLDRTRPIHLQDRGNYHAVALPAQDAYYVQVIWTHDDPGEAFVPFFRRVLREVDAQKPKRLILDFRLNIGGDGSRWEGVIREFIKRDDQPPWGELYLLTGPKCLSACVDGLAAFLDHTRVSVVGEPAAAPLNAFGDAELSSIDLPATGLHLNVSGLRHLHASSDDLRAFTPVYMPAPFAFADYIAGRDPAVDAILRGEEMRSLVEIAHTDGAAAAKAAYESRKSRFARLAWWAPADREDLNRLGNDLRRAGKFSEAVAVLQLNAEIFPDWWNSWDSLGEAQLAAGEKAAGLASYAKALELNSGDGFAQQAVAQARAGK
ncbi:MAG: hypothetical protein ACXU8S_00010 [Phenylobacterium sp.]